MEFGFKWFWLLTFLIKNCWDGPYGAVNDAERPSWFIPVPRSCKHMVLFLWMWFPRIACKYSVAKHSPRPYPSALESSVLHLPSCESAWIEFRMLNVWDISMHWVPAAWADTDSCLSNEPVARCTATRLEEHAVSRTTFGPMRPKVNEGRPTRKLSPFPVAEYPWLYP